MNPKTHQITLKFWQRLYLAVLALFLVCLFGGLFGVAQISCNLSFDARRDAFLTRQHSLTQTLAEDISAVLARRPDALPSLLTTQAARLAEDGLQLAVRRVYRDEDPDTLLDTLPAGLLDQLWASGVIGRLGDGQRVWQIVAAQSSGAHYLYAINVFSGPLERYYLIAAEPIEDFYTQWHGITALFLSLTLAVAVLFAIGLYAVLRTMNRPLDALTQSARAMAAGNYTIAIGQSKRRDELGELARTLEELAARVDAQLKELAAENEAKQMLVDDLSHEMRTPLTAIGGYAEFIQRADLGPKELAEATDTIRFESRRLLNLSNQLVQLSLLRNEPPEQETIPAATLLRAAARAVVPKAARRGIKVGIARPEEGAPPVVVRGQPDLLESLLVNLCDNGVKACERNGRVTLYAAWEDGAPVITVRDTGHGMDPETLARIGQPFYRADKARSRAEGGAGLGVALCQAIVEAHGAVLEYRSAPGHGTTVRVRFPGT